VGPVAIAAATMAAVGAGELETARRLCRFPATPDVDTTVARTLAMLGGDVDEVRSLWSLVPEGDTASPIVAAIGALIALELGDRQRLRELAVLLAAARETACGRVLLARIHLDAGQPDRAGDMLAGDDSPVARLLRARSLAAIHRMRAIEQLASSPRCSRGGRGTAAAGLAHAAVDPGARWPSSKATGDGGR
jgi:hypothetical protein